MTDEQIYEVFQVLHHRMTEAFDRYTEAKMEKDDGSPDWKLFHETRVAAADRSYLEALNLKHVFKDHFNSELTAITNKMMGE